jgi:mono/diheme cytochrome c family protein
MRYTRVGQASYLIAVLLIGAAVAFAWSRSRMPAQTGETPLPRSAEWQSLGAAVYQTECSGCHPAGQAFSGAPPLHAVAVDLFLAPGGREYLIRFLLTGDVRVLNGTEETYVSSHPPFDHLPNDRAAAVLDYMLTAWGNDELLPGGTRLYDAGEIAALRE